MPKANLKIDGNMNASETLGARLRNLLTPYATLLSVVKLLKTVEEYGDNEKAALIKEKLYSNAFDNLQQLIDFSETEEMEKNIWKK